MQVDPESEPHSTFDPIFSVMPLRGKVSMKPEGWCAGVVCRWWSGSGWLEQGGVQRVGWQGTGVQV